jgi:glycosyltransferase involved in cell wall biosynthesis
VLLNSHFHSGIISGKLQNPNVIVLHPPVSLKKSRPWASKEKIILSVGRFFQGLHSKRQDILLQAFRVISMNAPGWKLVLAGGRGDDEGSLRFFEQLQAQSSSLPVELRPNIPKNELDDLYERASFYWHAAGFEAPAVAPERMEHFGITTVEAMSAGCIPFVYKAGGQLEIIEEGTDGVFWETEGELIDKTLKAIDLGLTMDSISEAAVSKSHKFSKENFVQKLLEIVSRL